MGGCSASLKVMQSYKKIDPELVLQSRVTDTVCKFVNLRFVNLRIAKTCYIRKEIKKYHCGHKTMSVFLRYNLVDEDDLRVMSC